MEEDLDKIARLVNAKEYRLEQPTEGGVIGTEIGLNPTDSVTSDGTPPTFTGEIKPPESQDELWRELESKHLVLYTDAYYPVVTDEGKSKFKRGFPLF